MPPLMDVTIEPKSRSDATKLLNALGELVIYDPMLSFHIHAETGQTLIHGMSEAHLDEHIETLRRTFQIDVLSGSKQVAYRETLVATTELACVYKKQSGGSGCYAEVKIVFEPRERDTGIVFENMVRHGVLPDRYIAAIEKGVRIQAEVGVLAGFPTVDFKFTLINGKYHDVDSHELAFEIAAKACFRKLNRTDSPRMLEPVMAINILTPPAFVQNIVDDLISRRGRVRTTTKLASTEIVIALVPLKQMFGYHNALSRLSQSKARFIMQYESHEIMPLSRPSDDLFPSAMAMRA